MQRVAGKPDCMAFYHQSSTNLKFYKTPYTDFYKVIKSKLVTRSELGKRNLIEGYDVIIYTKSSKMSCRVGSGVISEDLTIIISLRLPDERSTF